MSRASEIIGNRTGTVCPRSPGDRYTCRSNVSVISRTNEYYVMPETVPENISGAFLHKHLFQFMVFGDPLLFVMLYPSRQFVQDSNAKISFTKAVIFAFGTK